MCQWGDTIDLLVPIDPQLAFDGQFRWDTKAIDRCIAPMVDALNKAGIYTSNCCCGHGKERGAIYLHDGRVLYIETDADDGGEA